MRVRCVKHTCISISYFSVCVCGESNCCKINMKTNIQYGRYVLLPKCILRVTFYMQITAFPPHFFYREISLLDYHSGYIEERAFSDFLVACELGLLFLYYFRDGLILLQRTGDNMRRDERRELLS